MRKIIVWLVVFLMLAVIPFPQVFAEETGLISEDELLNLYQLEQAELYAGDFIAEYEITREFAETVDITPFYELFVEVRENEKNDFLYLLEGTGEVHEGGLDADQIHRVLWFRNPAPGVVVRLFDLRDKTLYYGEYNILSDISSAESRPLSQEDCDRVIAILEENQVTDWAESYPCTIDDSTGWQFWTLNIEYQDGTMRQFSGGGSQADNMPDTYSQIREALEEMAE